MLKKIIIVLQFLVFSGAIYYLSSLENPFGVFPQFNIWDKLLHFVGFLLYSISTSLAFRVFFYKKNCKFAIAFSFIFFVIFAGFDELHQDSVIGRTCDIYDFIADIIGGLIGTFVIGRYLIKKI